MPGMNSIIAGAAFVKIGMDSAELTKGLKESQSRMKRFIAGINEWGTQVGLISAIVQAPFLKAVQIFSDFDLKMRQVKAITGATGRAFDELSEKARALGRATSFTTAEVANGMVALGRLGFSVKEVKDAIKPVMNLAKATGDDLAVAAQVAGNQMRVFGLDSSHLGDITDVVVTTVNKSAQTLNDFAEAAVKAGPNFANTGSDIREMSASLGVLANMGIRGALAGTALSRSVKRLADPRVKSFLRTFGIDVEDAQRNMRPLHETLADVAKVMSTLSHAERIHIAEEIFEVRGSLAGLPLSVNAAAIDEFLQQLRNCGGEAARVAKEMDSGIYGAIKRMESAFNDLYITIGKLWSFDFSDTIAKITQFVNSVNNASGAVGTLLGFVMQFGTYSLAFGVMAKGFSMWLYSAKQLVAPLLAIDRLVSGSAAAAERAAEIEKRSMLEKTALQARDIANQKRLEAERLKVAADADDAVAKQKREAQKKVAKQMSESSNMAKDAKAAALAARADLKEKEEGYQSSIRAAQSEVAALESQKASMKDTLDTQRQVAESAGRELEVRTKASALAAKQYDDAKKALDRSKDRDALSTQLRLDAASKKSENDKLQALATQRNAEKDAASKRLIELQGEVNANEAAQQKKVALVESYNKKIAAGDKHYVGLAKAENNRLATLRAQHEELERQLNTQRLIAREAEKTAASATRQANIAQKAYNAAESKSAGVVGADVRALQAEAESRRIAAEQAANDKITAQAAKQQADADLQIAQQAARSNDLLIKQKTEQIAKDREAMSQAQATAEKTIAQQQSLQAQAEATNASLRAQNRELSAEAANAEAIAGKSRKAAAEASSNAEKASRLAAQHEATAREFGSKAERMEMARENLAKAQAEKNAAERIMNEKAVTAAKAFEAKKQAADRKANVDFERQMTQLEVDTSNERAHASIAEMQTKTAALKKIEKEKLKSVWAVIDAEKIEIASHEKVIASIEKEKQAYIANARGKTRKNIERGRDINVKHFDQRIAKEREIINLSQQRIELARRSYSAETAGIDREIAAMRARQVELKNEIKLRLELLKASNAAGARAGWKSYVASEKAFDADVEAESAKMRLVEAENKLSVARRAAMTDSQKYAAVIARGGAAHTFTFNMLSRHRQAILATSAADIYAASVQSGASKLRAAGYAAEAVAAKGAAFAAKGLKVALDAISAHPVMFALVALVGTISLVNRMFDKAAEKARGEAAAFGERAAEHAKHREELKKEYDEMRNDIGYLVELERLTSLNSEQQQSAIDIIAKLSDKYGDLGITLDSVTQKLNGAAAAQKRLSDEQQKAIMSESEKEIKELTGKASSSYSGFFKTAQSKSGFFGRFTMDNVSDEQAEILKRMGYTYHEGEGRVMTARGGYAFKKQPYWDKGVLEDIGTMSTSQLSELRDKIQDAFLYATKQGNSFSTEQQQLEELKRTLEELIEKRKEYEKFKKGGAGNGNADAKTERAAIEPAPSLKDFDNARKQMEKLDEAAASRHLSSLQKESKAIEENRAEYRSLIETQLEYHRNELKIAEDKLNAIPASSTKSSDRIAREANEGIVREQTAAIRELSGKLAAMEDTYNQQLKEAYIEDSRATQRKAESDENAISDILAKEQQRRAQTAETEQYNKLVKDNKLAEAIEMMDDLLAKNSEALKQATDEYNKIFKIAREGGYYDGTMGRQDSIDIQDNIERLRGVIQEAAQRETHLLQQRDEARRAAETAVTKGGQNAIGSFSAAALSRAVGASGLQLRIAKATEGSESTLNILKASIAGISSKVSDLNSRLAVAGA